MNARDTGFIARPALILAALCGLSGTTASAQRAGTGSMAPALSVGRVSDTAKAMIADFNAARMTDPRWARWRQLVGPVAVGGVETLPATGLRVWVRGVVSGAWLGWEFVPTAAGFVDRSRVPVFWLGGGPPPTLRRPRVAPVPETSAGRIVAAYLDSLTRADLFSGAVIVSRNGRTVFEGAFGFANRAHGVRNALGTQFHTASVGKAFTAAAIARLVATGRLSYEQTVGAFLPEYPVEVTRAATVGQLLSHASGAGRAAEDWIAAREQASLAALVRATAAPSRFAPGTAVEYSNEAFLVAGRIVEVVSGMPYDDFVRREVFTRAGMRNTDWETIDRVNANRAVPYSNWRFIRDSGQVFVAGPRRDVTFLQGLRGSPAGGAVTTAPDLNAFIRAIHERQLIDSAGVAALLALRMRRPQGGGFAYGFEVNDEGTFASKGGNAQGSSAQIEIALTGGYSMVILSNYDQAAQIAAAGLRERLGG